MSHEPASVRRMKREIVLTARPSAQFTRPVFGNLVRGHRLWPCDVPASLLNIVSQRPTPSFFMLCQVLIYFSADNATFVTKSSSTSLFIDRFPFVLVRFLCHNQILDSITRWCCQMTYSANLWFLTNLMKFPPDWLWVKPPENYPVLHVDSPMLTTYQSAHLRQWYSFSVHQCRFWGLLTSILRKSDLANLGNFIVSLVVLDGK